MRWRRLVSWPRPRGSIRRFAALWMATLLALLSVLDFALSYPRAAHEQSMARDKALARVAAGYLRSLRAHDADTSRIPASVFREELGIEEPPTLFFRISNARGEWVGGDKGLKASAAERQQASMQPVLFDGEVNGQPCRVAAVRDYLLVRAEAEPVVVHVAEPLAARVAARRQLMRSMVLHQSIRLAVVLLVAWAVMRVALQPLASLSAELKQRRPHDLTPVGEDRPEELRPLLQTLNELLAAQQASVDHQRKFLADASHQLRTPIAVLRTQLQGLLGGQTSADDTLPKMLLTIDRASSLTNQLLSMAKLDQLARRADWVTVDLDTVARDVSLEFAPLIGRKRLDFSLQSGPLKLSTDPWLLGELVRNLLSNAIQHSGKGGALGIVVRHWRHEAEMIVWDHGGGVDEHVLHRLFEPFNAAKGGTGIGLGLSICRQIADSMGASVELFNRIEAGKVVGVDAIVRWPLHDPARVEKPCHA